ncbi:undecaprenyl/decaprenyl-phosphate alpha-N-acetylglucosaminyl 1-phosphate transferase [candidate division KSB1 bacterium]|nr:undecaprenyl/decaprenyl-phosphate alpha-N-acetylglucosaminyl 1-phosphate transferase [candidate division KSB1 bacterium]
MYKLWGVFCITLFVSLALTPVVRRLSGKLNIYAKHSDRTMHVGQIPKLGGAAILVAFYLGIILFLIFDKTVFAGINRHLIFLTFGSFILFILGALDDKFDLNCNIKLFVEFVVAILAVIAGWRIEVLLLPGSVELELGLWTYPVSVLWIAGIINAINLIDGLDGLASGIIIVVLFLSASIAALFGNFFIAFLAVILAGAVFGFLRYNLNPASIFLGDAGSLSLGFLLGCLTMQASEVYSGKTAALIPLLLLWIPITDTILAIVRRVRRRVHPFHADQDHLHHRLVRLGLSQSGAAMVLIGLSLIFGIMALLFAQEIRTEQRLFTYLVSLFK